MYKRYIKRLFDIVLSLIAILILAIVFIPTVIAIKMEDGGPIFYNANRLGKNMIPFKMYKFRSMKVNAEDIRNADGSTYNADDDPRVTKVGRFIRKTSIDELPQIFNVLMGTMSFVGPRPSPLGNESMYSKEYLRKFEVLPGITGYNQAVLRNNATYEQRVENDLYYVDNLSFTLDLKVIYLTAVSVLKRKNINRN
ncbi:sugar transferase [Peptoniphilaceae bacterium SGI.131]